MLANNSTSVGSPAAFNLANPAPLPTIRLLAGLQVRNDSTIKSFQLLDPPSAGTSSTPGNQKPAVECPVYCALLTAENIPAYLKDGIVDQASLEKKWTRTVEQLQTQSISEQEALEILKSGILQRPTGRALAPLLVEALMLSIRPKTGLNPERSREFVEIICHLPPEKWADALGERVNFSRGVDGTGVQGFIQNQLIISRQQRDEKIAAGELLDDDTWSALRDLTKQIELGEFNDVRPSLKEAKLMIAEFTEDNSELIAREGWTATVQQIELLLASVEGIDNRPDRSLLEEIVDPQSLQQKLSNIATPINAALNALGSITLDNVATGLRGAMSEALEKTTHDFAFGSDGESSREPQTELVSTLLEIDRTSSFYEEVDTSGPRYTGGFWGKVLYVANVLNTVGVLQIAETIKPHLTAVPMQAPVSVDTPPAARMPANMTMAELLEQVAQLQAEVNGFLASIGRLPEAGFANATDPGRPVVIPPSAPIDESTLQRWTQAAVDAVKKLDALLTFPMAAAADVPDSDGSNEELLGWLASDPETRGEGHQGTPFTVLPAEHSPEWWESIVPQIRGIVASILAALAPYRPYIPAPLSGAIQLLKDHPRVATVAAVVTVATATIATVSALSSDEPPIETPSALPPVSESPTLHQERIDDSIENILDTSIDSQGVLLSDAILDLMYESAERDLLDDSDLIEAVALLLTQHSAKIPAKTYVELIETALEETHSRSRVGQSDHLGPASSQPLKRSARSASEHIEPEQGATEDSSEVSTTDERTDTPEALVQRYLQTMDEQGVAGKNTDEEIDNEPPADGPQDAAKHVIHLLRSRRDVVWTDASQANGDRALATRYAAALLQSTDTSDQGAGLKIVVPVNSEFGQHWTNFDNAFNSPAFIEWATDKGLDLSTIIVNFKEGSLSGMKRGVRYKYVLASDNGWANVAAPLLTAAQVIDPLGQGVKYSRPSFNAPFALVRDFYGESRPLTKEDAQRRASELNLNQAFNKIRPDDPLRPPELRSKEVLDSHKRRLGDVYSNHALMTALKAAIQGNSDNAPVKLDAMLMAAHKDSSFSAKYPAEAKTMVTAQRYIQASGWTEPKTKADVINLVNVLSIGIVEKYRGNYWGASDYPRPLTPAQQNTVISETASFLSNTGYTGLLDYLLHDQDVAGFSQEKALDLALDSEKGKTFGRTLESALNGISTSTSIAEWLMAALVLDLNPLVGSKRNHVTGYNLTQEANWGLKPSAVIAALETHILAGGKTSATVTPIVARHLLGGIAPEFLVQNPPDNLVCGTHTWAALRTAVNRIEQLSPGSTSRMTFEQVMEYGDTSPISVGQEIAVEMAVVNPLIDWAIASGVIIQTETDVYTEQQLGIVKEKFQQLREELGHAQRLLTAKMPTRKEIALAELTRVYGKDIPFERIALANKNIPQSARKTFYSMLDLYITGHLKSGVYKSIDSAVEIHKLENKISSLEPVSTLFEKKFAEYFDGLRAGSVAIFKHLASQLPLEDRRSLEYGTNTYYTLRGDIEIHHTGQTSEQIENAKGRHGLLIRSEHQGKVSYYEIFPSAVNIAKRTDLPDQLTLGGTLVRDLTRAFTDYTVVERGTPQRFDLAAYQTGAPPRAGVTSNVIIEQLVPLNQYATFYRGSHTRDSVPNMFSRISTIDNVARIAIEEHFVTGREALLELARGSTASEDEEIFKGKVKEFFLGLVPFKSCVDNIINRDIGGAAFDCTLDAAGFLIPGARAVGKGAQAMNSGGRFLSKALKLGKIAGSTLVTSANPFDGIGDIAKFGKNAVCQLGSFAYDAASKGINQLKALYGCTKAIDPLDVLKHADIAEGTCDVAQGVGEATKITARLKNGKWYAYDATSHRAYGPPLENFKPDSTLPLERTTLGEGVTAYTNSKLFTGDPHTIHRSSGVDVVVDGKVYRFDPKQPDELTDLMSPAYFKKLEGFHQVCGIGGRGKRTGNCFAKIIDENLVNAANMRVQAIEHKRLYPSKAEQGVQPSVIHERRIYACDSSLQDCNPVPLIEPLQFKKTTTGQLIPNEHFGFANQLKDAELADKTRVVKIGEIVQGVVDAREVRAFIVDVPGTLWGKTSYLVAEADTGLFYYAKYNVNAKSNSHLDFVRVSKNDETFGGPLIDEYHKIKDPYLAAAQKTVDQDFIALPTLASLEKKLESIPGWDEASIAEFKAIIKDMSDAQKRELVLAEVKLAGAFDVEVIIPAIKIEPIFPSSFRPRVTQSEFNRLCANGAKAQVDAQMTATGLGSFNKRIPTDAQDVLRARLTQPVVVWLYSRQAGPDGINVLIKTGAGNCDQMALVSHEIVRISGGTASLWGMPGAHSFLVVGVPRPGPVPSTIGFTEPAFKDAWIVDPWADISCPAKDYMKTFEDKMSAWEQEGKEILSTDWNDPKHTLRWMSPTDSAWINKARALKHQY